MQTWTRAVLGQGALQPYGRAWAWTKWTARVPLPPDALTKIEQQAKWPLARRSRNALELELVCKAVDTAMNHQPERPDSIWSLRGVLNNSWHRYASEPASLCMASVVLPTLSTIAMQCSRFGFVLTLHGRLFPNSVS
eukprot:SAG31_NODE_4239_length_3431_cov_2.742197_2_plen_137_part_00